MRHIRIPASTIAIVHALTCGSGALLTVAVPRAQTALQPVSLQERLSRVRNDVIERPERADASVKELHQILTIDPTLAEAHLLLGLSHAGRGSQEMKAEAVAEFRQALELNPRLVSARFSLARVYLDLGLAERAREELLKTIEDAPRQPQVLALLGEVERRLSRPARAAEVARQALGIDPNFAQARYYLGLALLDLGQRDVAIAELEAVVKSGVDMADVYISLGVAYVDAGRIDTAIRTLTRGLALDPGQPDARVYLARAYRLTGQLVRAQTELDLVLPPGTPMQASAYYQRIETDIFVEQGLIRLGQNRVVAARQAFEKALALTPGHGLAHQQLATVYLKQGLAVRAAEQATLAMQFGAPVSAGTRAAIDAALPRTSKPTAP